MTKFKKKHRHTNCDQTQIVTKFSRNSCDSSDSSDRSDSCDSSDIIGINDKKNSDTLFIPLKIVTKLKTKIGTKVKNLKTQNGTKLKN